MPNRIHSIIFSIHFIFVCSLGQIQYAPFTTSGPISNEARTIQIADLNNDGLNDFIIGTRLYLFVFLQQENDTFVCSQTFLTGTVSNLAVGDLNNDGLTDAVFTYDWTSNNLYGDSIRILYQTKGGKLIDGGSHYVGFKASAPAIGDLNGDGLNDIIVSECGGGQETDSMRVFYQRPFGNFDSSKAYFANHCINDNRIIGIGDFNGDGLNDIVVNDAPDYKGVSLYLQKADHSLVYSETYRTPYALGDLSVGDFNHDGKLDFAIILTANMPDATLYVFYQDSIGKIFNSPKIYPTYEVPESIVAGDIDGDGKTDLVIAHGGWERITIYHQKTNNDFDTTVLFYPYCSHIWATAMDIGDINNDHKNDIVLIDWYWGVISLLNQSPKSSYVRRTTTSSYSNDKLSNYPNPFNSTTVISFGVKTSTLVKMTIFDLFGREVSVLINRTLDPGNYSINWNASKLSSGVYFCRIISNDFSKTVRMVLAK